MREIGSFLGWVLALTGSVLGVHLIIQALSLPADISVVATILPLVAALTLLEYQGSSHRGRKVLIAMAGVLLLFIALLVTTFLLTLGQ